MSAYTIRYASPVEAAELHSFHINSAGEYVWPRTLAQLENMVRDRAVFVVEHKGALVGMAYTRHDPDQDRWEFGGAFVDPDHRSNGLAGGLARVALIAHFSVDDPPEGEPLIAHVHEFNPSPIREILSALGFERTGTETPPSHLAPATMKRNDDGEVVGELYTFSNSGLQELAGWLGEPDGRYGVEVDWFDRNELAADLLELAAERAEEED